MNGAEVSALLTAAGASLVEFVEALTVVMAAGAACGWRAAGAGGLGGLAVLAAVVGMSGPVLPSLPLAPLRVVAGALLVAFGARWLRKATRRAAGVVPLRDERAAFVRHRSRIAVAGGGAAASFGAVVVEGLEVVFVVVAVGAGGPGLMRPAAVGAVAALAVVAGLGAVLRGPIRRVPDNAIKRVVGGVLCGVGLFWVGEGAGVRWPGGAACAVVLAAGCLALSFGAAAVERRRSPRGAA